MVRRSRSYVTGRPRNRQGLLRSHGQTGPRGCREAILTRESSERNHPPLPEAKRWNRSWGLSAGFAASASRASRAGAFTPDLSWASAAMRERLASEATCTRTLRRAPSHPRSGRLDSHGLFVHSIRHQRIVNVSWWIDRRQRQRRQRETWMSKTRARSGKPAAGANCGGNNQRRRITTYAARLTEAARLAGKEIFVGSVAVYECQSCGHLMPTPKRTSQG